MEKCLNIVILFRISPQFQRCYRKFNPTLLHWATGFFVKIDLADVKKGFPGFLRISSLHRKTYSLKYWTRLPSVGQSVSPSIGICNPFLSRPWVPGLFSFEFEKVIHLHLCSLFIHVRIMLLKNPQLPWIPFEAHPRVPGLLNS